MINYIHVPLSIKALSNGFCCLKHLSIQIFAMIPVSLIQSTPRSCKSHNLQFNLYKLPLVTKWDYKVLSNKDTGNSCKASQKHTLLERKREVCLPVLAVHSIMFHFSSISTRGKVSSLSQYSAIHLHVHYQKSIWHTETHTPIYVLFYLLQKLTLSSFQSTVEAANSNCSSSPWPAKK